MEPESQTPPRAKDRDLGAEFSQAAEMGRLIIRTAQERSTHQVRGHLLSMSFLDPQGLSQEATKLVTNPPSFSPETAELVNKASLRLTLEAALQVVEWRPKGTMVIEDTDSLEQLLTMLKKARDYFNQEATTSPETAQKICKQVILTQLKEGKIQTSDLPSTPQKGVEWGSAAISKAVQRITNKLDIMSRM